MKQKEVKAKFKVFMIPPKILMKTIFLKWKLSQFQEGKLKITIVKMRKKLKSKE